MKPLDPRLLRWARSVRGLLIGLVVIGIATTVLIVLQASLLAESIVTIFQKKQAPEILLIAGLIVIFFIRATLTWLSESLASKAAIIAKSELRVELAQRILRLDQPIHHSPGELTHLSTRGIDALDSYFSRYLPQLVLAVIVPISLSLVVLWQDWLSAILLLITIPLIPVFAILIGLYTKAKTDQQLTSLNEISNYYTDVISGLTTLRIFGRTKSQSRNLAEIDERYRKSTIGVLRISFLSSLALELLASISVAMIAVGIGLRLVHGEFDLRTGLFILILTPEIYLPLRAVGAQFHAAAEGVSASEQILNYLDTPATLILQPPKVDRIKIIDFRPSAGDLKISPINLEANKGSLIVITGESGSGKTSFFRALMGTVPIGSGQIQINDGYKLDLISLRNEISWLPQHATQLAGSVMQTLRMGDPDISEERAILLLTRLGLRLEELTLGIDTRIDELGAGVSVGQRRKLALARALVRDSSILLLDEPTASLDVESEKLVITEILAERDRGRIIFAAVHGSGLQQYADQIISLHNSRIKP